MWDCEVNWHQCVKYIVCGMHYVVANIYKKYHNQIVTLFLTWSF